MAIRTIEGDLRTQNIGLSTTWHITHRRSRWHRVEETRHVFPGVYQKFVQGISPGGAFIQAGFRLLNPEGVCPGVREGSVREEFVCGGSGGGIRKITLKCDFRRTNRQTDSTTGTRVQIASFAFISG